MFTLLTTEDIWGITLFISKHSQFNLTYMSRRALIIGISKYSSQQIPNLDSCYNDAQEVDRVLKHHSNTENQEKNFTTEVITSDNQTNTIFLKDRIEEHFKHSRSISLLYISSHGYIENTGGYIVTTECDRGDQGISMNDILLMVNQSPAMTKIIILDCCHSGGFGRNPLNNGLSSISEGVTIISASAKNQYSLANSASGVFTRLLVHALEGGAANILGEISVGHIYGYIDKAMGEEGQRPMFLSNVRRYEILRKVSSQLQVRDLREITRLFKENPEVTFDLNETYEPTSPKAIKEHVQDFTLLQKFNRVNLVVPIDTEHMYYAAIEEKGCKLTSLGKSYWVMVKNEII